MNSNMTSSHIAPLDMGLCWPYNRYVNNRQRSVSVQVLKRCVVPVCGARGAFSWLYGSQKLAAKTFIGSFASVKEPFSLYPDWSTSMIEDSIFECLTSFVKLLNTRYTIHLGRAGKTAAFEIGFTKHDCYHL